MVDRLMCYVVEFLREGWSFLRLLAYLREKVGAMAYRKPYTLWKEGKMTIPVISLTEEETKEVMKMRASVRSLQKAREEIEGHQRMEQERLDEFLEQIARKRNTQYQMWYDEREKDRREGVSLSDRREFSIHLGDDIKTLVVISKYT